MPTRERQYQGMNKYLNLIFSSQVFNFFIFIVCGTIVRIVSFIMLTFKTAFYDKPNRRNNLINLDYDVNFISIISKIRLSPEQIRVGYHRYMLVLVYLQYFKQCL